MTGCIFKLPDGRCDKPGKYMAFCIGEACSSATPSNYDLLISKTPEEIALFIHNAEAQAADIGSADTVESWLGWLKSQANKEGDG